MPVDEDLVSHIKATLNPPTPRVYHMGVWLMIDDETNPYPCVVYELANDPVFDELDPTADGGSDMYAATYNVYLLCENADMLRDWAKRLSATTGVYATTGWREWNNDVEQYELPAEKHLAGIQQTVLQVTLIRKGK